MRIMFRNTSDFLKKAILLSFYFLLFLTPLIILPQTSELFEFNKMVFTYLMTTIIVSLWTLRIVFERKLIFERTILDIPLLLFLFSQTLSTFLSVDMTTSLFGFYGRFHGGLISTTCYLLLYWAYVSNMSQRETVKSMKFLLVSGFVVSVIAFFEHFGTSLTCLIVAEAPTSSGLFNLFKGIKQSFDPSCWTQDFATRVFSTLGQPNWLASWLAVLLPISISFLFTIKKSRQSKSIKHNLPIIGLSLLFITVIIFTKSRSGMVSVFISMAVYLVAAFLMHEKIRRRFKLKPLFVIIISTIFVLALVWSPSTKSFLNFPAVHDNVTVNDNTNQTIIITDSLSIRKIVWQGALDIWREYPIIGSGVETFAIMFPHYQPVELNTTSEWDFVFNKAHNEYLHILSTTGIIGITTYLILIFTTIRVITKLLLSTNKHIFLGLLAGYATILITNSVSFSVVSVGLVFFLIPAFAHGLTKKDKEHQNPQETPAAYLATLIISIITILLMNSIYTYWSADVDYKNAQHALDSWQLRDAEKAIVDSLEKNPHEPLYWNKKSDISSQIAVALYESGDTELANFLAEDSLVTSKHAQSLSYKNTNLKLTYINVLIRLSGIDSRYLSLALTEFDNLIPTIPTDPKARYNYALLQMKNGLQDEAYESFTKSIQLKPNYKDPRFAIALIDNENGNSDKALTQLNYIREHIDPFDKSVNTLFDRLMNLDRNQ